LGRYRGLQLAVFILLGDRCRRCGIKDRRVFVVDHARGDGAKHRRALGGKGGGPKFWIDVLRRIARDPGAFQLLCANDHMKTEWQRRRHPPRRA